MGLGFGLPRRLSVSEQAFPTSGHPASGPELARRPFASVTHRHALCDTEAPSSPTPCAQRWGRRAAYAAPRETRRVRARGRELHPGGVNGACVALPGVARGGWVGSGTRVGEAEGAAGRRSKRADPRAANVALRAALEPPSASRPDARPAPLLGIRGEGFGCTAHLWRHTNWRHAAPEEAKETRCGLWYAAAPQPRLLGWWGCARAACAERWLVVTSRRALRAAPRATARRRERTAASFLGRLVLAGAPLDSRGGRSGGRFCWRVGARQTAAPGY